MKIRESWVGQISPLCFSFLYRIQIQMPKNENKSQVGSRAICWSADFPAVFFHICNFEISQIQIRNNENKRRAICWDVSAARGNKSKSANAGNYFSLSFFLRGADKKSANGGSCFFLFFLFLMKAANTYMFNFNGASKKQVIS